MSGDEAAPIDEDRPGRPDGAADLHGGREAPCPHLRASDGSWRSPRPSRDHRCGLLGDRSRLDLAYQRRYCVGAGHVECPVYGGRTGAGRFAATAPVLLERPALAGVGGAIRTGTARRAAAPVAVMVVGIALAALVLARGPGSPGTGGGGGAVGTATPAASARPTLAVTTAEPSPSATPTPTPAPTPSPTPARTPGRSPVPSRTPAPSLSGRTYTVQRGDTLYSIAVRFGTTSKVLAQINGITNPGLIRVGQVIALP